MALEDHAMLALSTATNFLANGDRKAAIAQLTEALKCSRRMRPLKRALEIALKMLALPIRPAL
jgi:hypothetical protein